MRSLVSAWRLGEILFLTACVALRLNAALASAAERQTTGDSLASSVAAYALESIANAKAGNSASLRYPEQILGAADELVARALEAEAAGDADARTTLLRHALKVDPEYAPAHWQLGSLRVGDRWQTIEQATADISKDGKAEAYRQRRDQTAENATDQYLLAKWCRQVGLADQERAHLLFALQLDPRHIDANLRFRQLRRLNEPAARSEQAQARNDAKEAAAALRFWKPLLTRLRHEAEVRDPTRRREALASLGEINDLSALPALESVFADADGEVGSAVIAALARMDDQRATDSLIRYSVSANKPAVRRDAADELARRSMFSYVPTMMSILVPPTRMEFTRAYDNNGRMGYRLSLYQVGPVADVAYSVSSTAQDFLTVDRSSGQAVVSMDNRGLQQRTADTIQMAERIAAANATRQAQNERIAETLRVATGKNLDSSPESWWSWWLDHNEIYRLPEKPVVSTISLARVATAECFAPGTTVWTLSGPMPIERVKVGESVLSQKTSTGELAYKLVLATTLRPPSPLVVIRAGNQTIRATRGHPFWVSGVGWRMAKELEAGQRLHTAHGPVLIDSVEAVGQAPGHNLLVDSFNTYFVTDQLFLVHDNLIREVSPATVPGMTTKPAMDR